LSGIKPDATLDEQATRSIKSDSENRVSGQMKLLKFKSGSESPSEGADQAVPSCCVCFENGVEPPVELRL